MLEELKNIQLPTPRWTVKVYNTAFTLLGVYSSIDVSSAMLDIMWAFRFLKGAERVEVYRKEVPVATYCSLEEIASAYHKRFPGANDFTLAERH